ncbi:MAG: quinol:cytochrome C oxidoreductase [Chitinophagaceae bacterium]|nr:quinol:cytochrome C oxidoreductase [Chitinophagaceae bacterium]
MTEKLIEKSYIFTTLTKKRLLIVGIIGVVLSLLGILLIVNSGHNEIHSANVSEGEHSVFHWTQRLFANLWINNVFFTGLSLIGVFFVAIQYAAQAGWSAGIKRIPEAFGYWLPIAGVLTLVIFLVAKHDLFHWTHESLYDKSSSEYDSIIDGKKAFLNIPFYLTRIVVFFSVWFFLFWVIRKHSLAEDIDGGHIYWKKIRVLSTIFLVFFAVSSSISAWDWILSIDTHWFSTMIGWYVFASWWVSGLALITYIVASLKDRGYLNIINENHLHDLGKFVWGFSIFWTYIWFSQFLLIYYAHIPEETIYFLQRWKSDHYAPIFFINLIVNFFLPFLILMPRDAKRYTRTLKLVCPIVILGHWLDFYLMVTPGTLKENGGIGFLEIGLLCVYFAAFLYVILSHLAKVPLVAKNHPLLEESLHHHI